MISISDRGRAICVMNAEKSDLWREASILTGRMYIEAERSKQRMQEMSRQQETILHKIAAIEQMESRI